MSFITSTICIVMYSWTSKSGLAVTCLVINILNVLLCLLYLWMLLSLV